MSLPGRFLSIGGQRVFYHRHRDHHVSGGKSKPVVLLHGFAVSHWCFRHIIPGLAEGSDVIAIDLPGSGESDRPSPAEYRYDAPAYMETVLGVLDALGLERASLLGHSMGGGVALYTAARRPERVDRVIAIDPLCYPYRLPLEGRALLVPVIGPAIFQAFFSRPVVRNYMRRQVYRDPTLATEEWVDYLWERLNRPGGIAAVHASLQFCHDPGVIARTVRAIRSPTLILWGDEDKVFPASFGSRLQTDIAGSELHVLRECGHAPPEEKPAEVVKLVSAFLAAAERTRRPAVVSVPP
jgi:pimeloyl-ACP methyl ester carboxylesterase